jgi:hypothetical protein
MEVVMADEAEREDSPTKAKRSRRELLAGAAGALGVLAAEAIGKVAPARAANGDPLILGQSNSETSGTNLFNSGGGSGLNVTSTGPVSGEGVYAVGFGTDSAGLHGQSASAGGRGVWGDAGGAGGVGVLGSTAASDAISVRGAAVGGRGGVFSGGKAQLKLSPSSASTHPKRGQRGDLFVDKSGRLWFCKGKTTWVQLA